MSMCNTLSIPLNSMCKTLFFSFAALYEKVLQHPHAITIFEDFVYWTDRYINRVMRAHKWHGENQTVMLFNLPQPMGLVAVHPTRQPAGMTTISNMLLNPDVLFPYDVICFENCTNTT